MWRLSATVMEPLQAVLVGSVLLILAGCSPLALSPPPATAKAPYTLAPTLPPISPIATVAPTGHGRPYTAEMIAVELQDVPYNFPPELRTARVAEVIADGLWTYDGQPYRELSFGSSCDDGPVQCEISVTGLPAFAPTRDSSDHYFWRVTMSSGLFTLGSVVLRGYPPEFDPEFDPGLDVMARSLDTEGHLTDMSLRSVRWALPPPDAGFVLLYQKGDLEGAHIVEVLLDRTNRKILSITEVQRGLDH